MPKRIVRVLKTSQQIALDPSTGGALASNIIKLNSAYDPTGNAGTGQPLGFDQYTPLYSKYCVIRWGIQIHWASNEPTTPLVVGFTPLLESSALSDFRHYLEIPGNVFGMVTTDKDYRVTTTRGGVKSYFIPPGGRMLSDDRVVAAVTADPTSILYGHVWC